LRCCAYKKIVFFLIMTYLDLVVDVEDFGIHGWLAGCEKGEKGEKGEK